MSSKLYKYIPVIAGTLAIIGGVLIKSEGLRLLYFIILIVVSMRLYEYLKKKELGYVLDEREYKYYLESLRYSFIILLALFLALWALKEVGKISDDFYLGFSLAYFTILIAHIVIYRILLWLK